MRIHFISDSPKSNSGFANVCKNISMGLKKLGHEVSISGFQTSFLEYYNGIPILPMATNIDEISQIQINIMKTNPNVVFYINDAYTDASKFLNIFPRMITYTPVEGITIPNHMVQNLNKVAENGKVIAQCEYGYHEMLTSGINVHSYIYHGYNPDIFHPIEPNNIDKESKYCYFKTEQGQTNIDPKLLYDHSCQNCVKSDINEQIDCLFYKEETITLSKYDKESNQWMQIEDVPISKLRDSINPSKKFMFLFVGANHMLRKKIERLLKAYTFLIKQSKQLEDRIHLHLHTNPISPTGIDLLEIANRFNIQNNISFSFGNWSENALNILYSIADCQVSATSSEGFSLPVLEGFATGLPMIAPDCTSQTELIGVAEDPTNSNKTIGPRGLLAHIQADYMIQDLTYRSLVDEYDLAEKMKELFNNKKMIEKYGQNSVHFAKNYTWEKICEQWDKLLKEFKM